MRLAHVNTPDSYAELWFVCVYRLFDLTRFYLNFLSLLNMHMFL